jgi:hypothetical protein
VKPGVVFVGFASAGFAATAFAVPAVMPFATAPFTTPVPRATPPLMPGEDAAPLLPSVVAVVAARVAVPVVAVPVVSPLIPGDDAVLLAPAVTPVLVMPDVNAVAPFVTPAVVATAPFVTPAVVPVVVPTPADAAVVARKSAPAAPASPVLLMTGVGAELIDEFTVCCGFAVRLGGMYCPVFAPAFGSGCDPAGLATPRTRPRKPWFAAATAIASVVRVVPPTGAGTGAVTALAIGGLPFVPDELPGVDAGETAGALVPVGWPLPGLRFVVQLIATADANANAAIVRHALCSFRSFEVPLRICPPVGRKPARD